MIVAGWSAYPRQLDFPRFREIADSVGAYLLVDMAHFAGLVAAGLHPSPVPIADVVTTTIHKTIGGGRGGMILCKEELRQEDRLGRLPRPAGRTARAHHRRQGGGAADRGVRGVPRAPGADAGRRAGGRRGAARRGRRRLGADRRHRCAPGAVRPARVRARRQAGRGPPALDRDHGQPQRGPVRPAAAGRLLRACGSARRRWPPAACRSRTSSRSARSSPPTLNPDGPFEQRRGELSERVTRDRRPLPAVRGTHGCRRGLSGRGWPWL